MIWDFEASTPEELANGIKPALLKGTVRSKTIANEKIQMVHLLRALVGTSVLQYPVRVRHTSDKIPDFQLTVAGRCIGVELTKIRFQDVEHGRALQERGMKGTLSVSSLSPNKDGPRKKSDIIKEGFGLPAMVFPISLEEEERIWLEQARQSLEAKTGRLLSKDFAHGVEDWLALVDTVGEVPEEAHARGVGLSRLLAEYWRSGWFARVFLQDNFYRWQLMFTREGFSVLPKGPA
jgi:hypothetical protein